MEDFSVPLIRRRRRPPPPGQPICILKWTIPVSAGHVSVSFAST